MTGWLADLLRLYKKHLSPWLPRTCRFSPTCSEYSRLVLAKDGLFKGSLRTLGRLMRCQPFHPGGIDLP